MLRQAKDNGNQFDRTGKVRIPLGLEEEGGTEKGWVACSKIDCRRWHLCSSATVKQRENALFGCTEVGEACRQGFRGERGTSQERCYDDHEENIDWKWVDAALVKGGAAAAEGRKDVASELATLKDYLNIFSLTANNLAGSDQSDCDEIWMKIKELPLGNQVTARSGTITRFLKEAKNLKLYDPSNDNAMKGGMYKTVGQLKDLEGIIKDIIWKNANLEQQTALIKALRAPVMQKVGVVEREAGTSAAQKKAEASVNTIALVAHALCDADNYNLIMQARGKVPAELRPEALSQGIQIAKANRYKDLVQSMPHPGPERGSSRDHGVPQVSRRGRRGPWRGRSAGACRPLGKGSGVVYSQRQCGRSCCQCDDWRRKQTLRKRRKLPGKRWHGPLSCYKTHPHFVLQTSAHLLAWGYQ